MVVFGTPLRRGAGDDVLSASQALTRYLLQHTMPGFLPALLCALAIGVLVAGCGDGEETGGEGPKATAGERPGGAGDGRSEAQAELAAAMRDRLRDAPKPLAALHAQANELLDGGAAAFERRLRQLRGYPVVVNKWASWCPPCREELPWFQEQALKRGTEIAFLGVDANDNDADAAEFLRELPLPFPSYRDPDLKVSAVFNGVAAFPTTAYYDSEGELAYLKQGTYLSEEDLVEDIERHAR